MKVEEKLGQLLKVEEALGQLLTERGLTLSTAESCTGGGIAARITSVAGSSAYFRGGIVAYANEVKTGLLHVSPATLEAHGAVSRETVVEMVRGAMKTLETDCAVATSGIAGPGGAVPGKPVGTIWIAAGCGEKVIAQLLQEADRGRAGNVALAIEKALSLLLQIIK